MIADSPTPPWVTDIPRQAGTLQHGTVTAVEARKSDAFNSQLRFLHLTYSDDAAPNLPAHLVLKRNIAADWAVEAGAEEVKFYHQKMPRCWRLTVNWAINLCREPIN